MGFTVIRQLQSLDHYRLYRFLRGVDRLRWELRENVGYLVALSYGKAKYWLFHRLSTASHSAGHMRVHIVDIA